MLGLYKWVLPNQSAHLNMYKDNEHHYNVVRGLWNSLDSASIYFILAVLIVSVLLVCFYYYGYNRWPGRKYKVGHWALWLVIAAVVTIVATMGLGYGLVDSQLSEKTGFILRISLINGVYSAVIYFISSFLICNIPVPTNAYRFLKIGK